MKEALGHKKVVVLATTPDQGLLVTALLTEECDYQLLQQDAVKKVGTTTVQNILKQTAGIQVRVADIKFLHVDEENNIVVYGVEFNSIMLLRIPPSPTLTVLWKERLGSGGITLSWDDREILRAYLPSML